MSIYGNKAYICETADDLDPQSFSEGYLVVNEMQRNPATVSVFKGKDKYYVSAESVMNYMGASGVTEIDEALTDIAHANKINKSLLETVGMFDDDCYSESLDEDAVLLEKAAEDNAMTLKQAEKYYNAVISNCKSKADSKETIDDCIKLLKQCVKDMQQAKSKAQSNLLDGGRVKYALKSLIPFNGIYRLFKKNDWQAGISQLADYGIGAGTSIYVTNIIKKGAKAAANTIASYGNDFMGSVAGDIAANGIMGNAIGKATKVSTGIGAARTVAQFGVRLATYTKMLDRMIKNTNEAIDYLEKKKKELDKK